MESKPNCWEFKKCGREPGGKATRERGPCPAATERLLDGVNGGRNGGRACWAISGTIAAGVVQESITIKLATCMKCEFYRSVIRDEGFKFVNASRIQERLQHQKAKE